jgi:HSP20 family protein
MTLVKRDNNVWLPSIFEDVLNADLFGGTSLNSMNTYVPAVNIKETENDFKIEVAAPGIKKENFNIELDNDELTIASELKDEHTDQSENYTRKEFNYNSFKRVFTLPDSANPEDIKADYTDGVLVVTIAKKEEAKKPEKKLIAIS